ncbi:type I restriction endonuclease [Sulfuricurvum sp.]|uniref:type I restriction endonuclease n=1 Tax=Sulfuricurvum sp. TaxID=2025608 RepID=UPI00261A3E4C|nr:type I restriction endonuclease [Sulfuricurvum sp.]MDD4884802.1 type I restriction endonuclease [Sulfuricurvum sp.]
MELDIKLRQLTDRIKTLKEKILTEEATKHSFVMPFLSSLGYDVFDPTVVVPEFTADIGTKKGEKVDYAILRDGKPIMVIEAKNHTEKLDNHNNQLVRYFNVTDSKFAILTNGIEYRFFSDMEETNRMDKVPFLVVNLENIRDRDIKELEKFAKDNLDVDSILNMANTKKYHREIQSVFKTEVENPSDEFVKFFARKFTDKPMTVAIVDEFRGYIKKSFAEVLHDIASDKINALQSNLQIDIESEDAPAHEEKNQIVTTDEELEGFYIVKSLLGEDTDLSNITFKDTVNYFTILYQGKVTKWLCRLYFNGRQKSIAFPGEEKGSEIKQNIDRVEDLYKFRPELKQVLEKRITGKE